MDKDIELERFNRSKSLMEKIINVNELQQSSSSNSLSSNTCTSDLSSEISQLQLKKAKKTRRKPKKSNKACSLSDDHKTLQMMESMDESALNKLKFDFKITAIVNQKNAKVFRVKNGICCKHINLNYLGGLLNNGVNKSGSSENSLRQDNRGRRPNESFYFEDYRKLPVKTTNGTEPSIPIGTHPDNSKLQSPSVQNASSSSRTRQKNQKQKKFPPYLSTQEVLEGLENGELIKGIIRINAKNFHEAYISNENRAQQDYLIPSLFDRNRALEGDVVAIKIKPENLWTDTHKTAIVVSILEMVHSRTAVGFLHLMPDKNKQYAQFIPRDFRIPRIKIPSIVCPPQFHVHPNRYENMLFKAKITLWTEVKNPLGTILDNVGVTGDLESETAAILAENDLDISPFTEDLLEYVQQFKGIPEEEFKYREDLRKECIFTIDPPTARDLDDAVSCKELENGNLEVGVHISDVAFYLKEGTPLDRKVSKKATTIYLVNDVYHMLPRELCMHCSLLPGEDKLAFSVFWEMTKAGKIVCHRLARTVINSCTQLSYDHAQRMIENPNEVFKTEDMPELFGGFTYTQISRVVNYLRPIAANLRQNRFEQGALRIDQIKLLFRLDGTSGEPTEYFVYENKEAHRLIEEFMLLANITVAQKINEDFPYLAFLRSHEPPNTRLLSDLQKNLKIFNINLDVSSSKTIQQSMLKVQDQNNVVEMAVLNHMLAKPMTRARYFCAGTVEDSTKFQHYALHVPLYTHFTSPIRRYADIMVHRLLAASLGYTSKPNWEVKKIQTIAENCNRQKYNAKTAGEASSDLFLAQYVADHQPFVQSAVVVDMKTNSFDILVIGTGTIVRMFPNAFGDDIKCIHHPEEFRKQLMVIFPETAELSEECYVVQLFSVVKVNLYRKTKTNKLEAKLVRPVSSQVFESHS